MCWKVLLQGIPIVYRRYRYRVWPIDRACHELPVECAHQEIMRGDVGHSMHSMAAAEHPPLQTDLQGSQNCREIDKGAQKLQECRGRSLGPEPAGGDDEGAGQAVDVAPAALPGSLKVNLAARQARSSSGRPIEPRLRTPLPQEGKQRPKNQQHRLARTPLLAAGPGQSYRKQE